MPFLTPAVIAAIAGAGATAYGANQSARSARGLQKQQQPLIDQQLALTRLGQLYGERWMKSGETNLDLVQEYFRPLVSGDRSASMQALAPEINALTEQSRGSVAAQRGLFPRGGQGAAQAAQIPTQVQGNINNLLFSSRPRAAQGLMNLGGIQADLGMGAIGKSAGLSNNLLNYGLNAQQQMFGQGASIGQGISSLFGPMMMWYMMNRGQSPSPDIPNPEAATGHRYSQPGMPSVGSSYDLYG